MGLFVPLRHLRLEELVAKVVTQLEVFDLLQSA
jgi:hypothetical protein